VAYNGRALPLGWVRVPHEGNSDLKLQQRLLSWFVECLPEGARRHTTIIADREFHSIHLATWIEKTLGLNFVLRIKAGTSVEYLGDWYNARRPGNPWTDADLEIYQGHDRRQSHASSQPDDGLGS
jgi:hypothetical protein